MSNILKTNPPSLVLAIQYNYDNTEGLTPEALLAYWAALTEAAKEDEPRRSFANIHAALPFTASTSFSLDLGGYEVFRQTEALAELFHHAQQQAAPTSARLASVITEHNIAEGYSIEDFAKASAVGLYLNAGLEDLPDVVTYDRIQKDPETLRDCAVWEVFEYLEHGTIAGLMADQYTQNLSDYQLCFDAGRKAAPTSAQSECHAQAVQLLREAQADLKRLCEEHDLDTSTHSGTTLAKVNQFIATHQR